jgi:hypothetical protein
MTSSQDSRSAWNRLEDTLLAVKVGDEITIDALVEQTGLGRETVERVLAELTRTELFAPKGSGAFVRRSLWQSAFRPAERHVANWSAGRL